MQTDKLNFVSHDKVCFEWSTGHMIMSGARQTCQVGAMNVQVMLKNCCQKGQVFNVRRPHAGLCARLHLPKDKCSFAFRWTQIKE